MPIGETLLGAVVQVALDKLSSPEVINFFKGKKFDKSLGANLESLMLAAQELLLDAEEKQMTDQAVEKWLDDLKHWVYRAEEVIDELATEALRCSLEEESFPQSRSLVSKVCNRCFVPCSNSYSFEKAITPKIKEVISMLESMLKRANVLRLRELSGAPRAPQSRETTCILEDSAVFGRDQEREEILQWVLSHQDDTDKIGVIAIVGMGGLGKTTLAKQVYHDERLEEAFDLKVWVCVSDPFDISRVTKSILELVSGQPCSGSPDLNFLQNELSSKLRKKKFLVVLDDVWNDNYPDWERLKAPLTAGSNHSKIIVTTRNDDVAYAMCAAPTIRLNHLSAEDGWSLFSRHAFELGISSASPDMQQIGRKIVQKCQGLPLAIKTLGGLLRFNQDSHEWESILQSSLWKLPCHKRNVIPALGLSYYYLPAHLKRCFAYCAIFPKNYKMDSKKLVLLWMAEGLLNDKEKRIEDVGDEYFRQLLARSLLEPLDESYAKMHDLMHDVAQVVSGNSLATQESFSIDRTARHFSYVADIFDGTIKFNALHKAKYLRTFLPLHNHDNKDYYLSNVVTTWIMHQSYCLRVLCLSRYVNLVIPESIGSLVELRYLDVSHTKIKQLPESVSNLYHLETLLLSDCSYLERLPTDIWKVQSLRHLDISGTTSLVKMPKQISLLKSLQTLTAYVVGKASESGIQELGKLLQIRGKLALRRLQNVTSPEDASVVNLTEREYLKELALEFDTEDNDDSERGRAVLEKLKPHASLKSLIIRNYRGTRFPRWLDARRQVYLENMIFLRLSDCLYCNSLPALGQLPCLKELQIEGMDNVMRVGPEFYGCSSSLSCQFPALEILKFKKMKAWEVWSQVAVGGTAVHFPRLRKLWLLDCPILKGNLPVHVSSLEKVEINGCKELGGLVPQVPSIHPLEMAACPYAELASALDLTSITTLKLVGLVQVVELPRQLVKLSSLCMLKIICCENLTSLAQVELPRGLKELEISRCSILESLPAALAFLTCLWEIKLSNCPCLRSYPGDSLPTSLDTFRVEECERWEFPITKERMHHYTSLSVLHFTNVPLVSFPLGIFPNLSSLWFNSCKLLEKVYIPMQQGTIRIGGSSSLMALESLVITKCEKVERIGQAATGGGGASLSVLPAPNLRGLTIWGCEKVKSVMIGSATDDEEEEVWLSTLTHLRIDYPIPTTNCLLRLSSLVSLQLQRQLDECFPHSAASSLPTSLKELVIWDFPNLKYLDGRALQHLTSLEKLEIYGCPKLECLPEERLPPSLGCLDIKDCPLLEQRCQRETGKDWSKIHHLPCVEINEVCISGP